MNVFYEDEKFKEFEDKFNWEEALKYLENLYLQNSSSKILCTIIGCAWYYYVEGPNLQRGYGDNSGILHYWKKYVDLGFKLYKNDPYFNYIAGYTLSLHGFFLDIEYGEQLEQKGVNLMQKCFYLSKGLLINKLAENFLKNEKSKKYLPLKDSETICSKLFNGESLINHYFHQIYIKAL